MYRHTQYPCPGWDSNPQALGPEEHTLPTESLRLGCSLTELTGLIETSHQYFFASV